FIDSLGRSGCIPCCFRWKKLWSAAQAPREFQIPLASFQRPAPSGLTVNEFLRTVLEQDLDSLRIGRGDDALAEDRMYEERFGHVAAAALLVHPVFGK